MMKALLIHTDGYTIDVVGQYDSVEEASRNLYLEYEKMCSQEIYPEWQQQSHCDYEDAILYLNGEDVHVWPGCNCLVGKEKNYVNWKWKLLKMKRDWLFRMEQS